MPDYKVNTQQLVCVATFTAKPGKIAGLVEALSALIADTRRENGCIRYELNLSRDNADKVTFVEKFVDEAAFNSHCEKEAIQHYFHHIMPELVASHHVETYHQVIV
ncbi:antibiotic biosynthesis monooxygenase [Shewanella sp. Choline-02u-19]|uniref:putative quinol monooxygenase n=1 Tax=unclassified Shewanella TaxID=196818 RepID=UPI000C3366A4|nr:MULTISPECIES: putative quinol monooxygenase [unclassified Shewanella]PKH57811.1 antibiotic biosynthesis monooxygenase [Shewanella sp. Bg11-22]PKI29772.1 antibiotic biosynthesis monooxygenase [Shewanella sp. Choline-02u-19]